MQRHNLIFGLPITKEHGLTRIRRLPSAPRIRRCAAMLFVYKKLFIFEEPTKKVALVE